MPQKRPRSVSPPASHSEPLRRVRQEWAESHPAQAEWACARHRCASRPYGSLPRERAHGRLHIFASRSFDVEATFLAVSVSIGLMAFLKGPAIVVALAILLTSFTRFTYLAFLFRSSSAWRTVAYPWTLATFVSILVALANISDSDTGNERRAAYVDLMFDMRAIETNESHPDPERLRYYKPNPAPNPQECGRIAPLIDQVERDFFNEVAQPTRPRATGWGEEFPHLQGSQGYWSGLYRDALDFDAVEKKDVPLLEQMDATGPGRLLTSRAASI